MLQGGCRGQGEEAQANIDVPPLAVQDPDAETPRVHFPPDCQQDDKALNAFIAEALKICQEGNYDAFCAMLGTREVPPSLDDFHRIWRGVGDIAVISVRSDGQESPEYYIHALVRLREQDRKGRQERDLVIRAYREADQWRLSGVTKEIAQKVLVADSQPASETRPAARSETARRRRD